MSNMFHSEDKILSFKDAHQKDLEMPKEHAICNAVPCRGAVSWDKYNRFEMWNIQMWFTVTVVCYRGQILVESPMRGIDVLWQL